MIHFPSQKICVRGFINSSYGFTNARYIPFPNKNESNDRMSFEVNITYNNITRSEKSLPAKSSAVVM